MNMHKNARLTPRGRERIVRQVESGQTPEAVAEAAGVCPRTVRKWLDRYRQKDWQATKMMPEIACPIFDRQFVEGVGIIVGRPLLRIEMIRVLGIGEGFEQPIEPGDAAAIFGRSVPRT